MIKKLTPAVVLKVLGWLVSLLTSLVGIKDNLAQLGLSRWTIVKAAVVLCVVAGIAYSVWQVRAGAVLATPSAVLATVEQHEITSKVQVYDAKAKTRLNLPKDVSGNTAKVVLAATDLPKDRHSRTVSTVLDTDTGEVSSYTETKPLPFLERAVSGSFGVYAGFKNLEPAYRAELKQDFLHIKGITVGGVLTVDHTLSGSTDTFVGAGARYDW